MRGAAPDPDTTTAIPPCFKGEGDNITHEGAFLLYAVHYSSSLAEMAERSNVPDIDNIVPAPHPRTLLVG